MTAAGYDGHDNVITSLECLNTSADLPHDIRHEVAFVKSTGTPLPQIDSVGPAEMLVNRK
jgi:hypothetical protein